MDEDRTMKRVYKLLSRANERHGKLYLTTEREFRAAKEHVSVPEHTRRLLTSGQLDAALLSRQTYG